MNWIAIGIFLFIVFCCIITIVFLYHLHYLYHKDHAIALQEYEPLLRVEIKNLMDPLQQLAKSDDLQTGRQYLIKYLQDHPYLLEIVEECVRKAKVSNV